MCNYFVYYTEKEEKTVEKQEKSTFSYFETIFGASNATFSDFELGKEGKTLYKSDSLLNGDYFFYSVEAEDDKITSIELTVFIQDKDKAQKLIQNSVEMYNERFAETKNPSNFVTWSYSTEKNLPAQVLLIYDKALKTISLDIGYKAQR